MGFWFFRSLVRYFGVVFFLVGFEVVNFRYLLGLVGS